MPQMGGRELANHLVRGKPHLNVLYMTGYTDDPIVRESATNTGITLLQKPFSPKRLIKTVREVLDG